MTNQTTLRLMQLVSPALPVGAYAYSQGLETAVERGWVSDEADARDWILGLMDHSLCHLDVPVFARIYRGFAADDKAAVLAWSELLRACRETAELQAEDHHLGAALARLLDELDVPGASTWVDHPARSFATLFAMAAVHWQIPLADAVSGYVWAWAENQVAAAIKLVPLGQTAGQRILSDVTVELPEMMERGLELEDSAIGAIAPALAMASALHEVQYSRLFRS